MLYRFLSSAIDNESNIKDKYLFINIVIMFFKEDRMLQ